MSRDGASSQWTTAEIPALDGRTAIVTGASAGLGLQTARILAEHGATVILACRDNNRAEQAMRIIRQTAPDADLGVAIVDLASLTSVRGAAEKLRADLSRIDLLINNAGAGSRVRRLTEDGYELTLATNHLGHFAFTCLLLERLATTPKSRVVTVTSRSHALGRIDFADLDFAHRRYSFIAAYNQSKLANLMFTYELQRRLEATDAHTVAVAAHPGAAQTEFVRHLHPVFHPLGSPTVGRWIEWAIQPAEIGALATLRAAVDPTAAGGDLYGPAGWRGMKGHPILIESAPRAREVAHQQRLWNESERLTGVNYPLPG